ncbi:arylesterase [Gimibacter soli]|uniref:Arylesterase n=2 Tax=Gimibacter soli TaxID=3024400 RepID=A0AAE9XRI3_9PROT|nr:arylesterase [Gimibacter soli]WCL54907.1 arylesterase [Gimibacter soli]
MAFGDSLTAGYGLPAGQGFTDRLQVWLRENGLPEAKVINAGVSGDTSSGGRSRLEWALAGVPGGKPDLVILELGANDGLRGVTPTITRENLTAMVAAFKEKEIPILLAGMLAPPNLGPDYAAVFNPIYPTLAEQDGVTLYPFFLDGVAADPTLNQSDGMHPNEEGVAIIVSKIGPEVLKLLTEAP